MLSGDGKGAMLFLTASMEEERKRAQEEDGQMEEDQAENDWSIDTEDNEWQDEGREASTLQINMNTATGFNLTWRGQRSSARTARKAVSFRRMT